MQIPKRYIVISFVVVCSIALTGLALAQLPNLPQIPKDVTDKIPDLNKMLQGEPPITSSMNDAVTEVAFLDDFDPPVFMPMDLLPRTTNGAFVLDRPGLFAIYVKSYCMKAGTYAPTKGSGYLLAPLKGPRSEIVRKLLHATYTHPEVTQTEIQALIWAIIARTKFSDMWRGYQVTAAKILSPKDIFELNNGALGLVPEDMMDQAFEDVPPALRSMLEAEARLRQKMTQGEASYEELEQIAVRFGAVPSEPGDREIPSGRWSFHPDGYFIRFSPHGYHANDIQIYVPDNFLIEKDALGRITAICNRKTHRIEIEYADTRPLEITGDANVRAYPFKAVRFILKLVIPPEVVAQLVAVYEKTGWTLVGIPSGKGKPALNAQYPNIETRYVTSVACTKEIERIDKELKIRGSSTDLVNLTHLKYALLDIVADDHSGQYAWAQSHIDVVSKAWQYELSRRAGTFVWAQSTGSIENIMSNDDVVKRLLEYISLILKPWSLGHASGKDMPTFDNTKNTSVPGNTGGQRIGNSNAGEADPCEQVRQALAFAKNVRQAYENVDPTKYADGDAYNDAAMDELNKILNQNGQASADPSSQGNAPMGTLPSSCDLGPGGTSSNYDKDWEVYESSTQGEFEEYIKNTYYKNRPDILWRGDRAHEQKHMNTCREQTSGGNANGYKEYMNDPKNYQKDEVAAYDEQIAKLQAWLDWNCNK